MSEKTVVNATIKALRARGLYVEKIHGSEYQAAGIPDLVGFGPGFGFGIEMKDPDKKPGDFKREEREALASLRDSGVFVGSAGGCSPLQAAHIRRIIKAGGRAGVAASVDEALTIIFGRELGGS